MRRLALHGAMLTGQWRHRYHCCHGIDPQDHRSQASLSLIAFKIFGSKVGMLCLSHEPLVHTCGSPCRTLSITCHVLQFYESTAFFGVTPSRQRLETPLWPDLGVKLLQINTLLQWPSSLADKESVIVAGSHKLAWYHGHIYVAWILFPEGTFCHAHVET